VINYSAFCSECGSRKNRDSKKYHPGKELFVKNFSGKENLVRDYEKKIFFIRGESRLFYPLLIVISMILTTSAQPVDAQTTYLLDWDLHTYPDSALQADFTNVAESGVDIGFDISGDTGQITELLDNMNYSGEQTGLEDSFVNRVDLSTKTQTITVTINFSKPVSNLNFVVHDIDRQSTTLFIWNMYNYIDQLQFNGLSADGNTIVYPQFSNQGKCVAIVDNQVRGIGGSADDQDCQAANNNGTNFGDVTVFFPQEVSQISYVYGTMTGGGYFVYNDTASQVVAFSDFSFEAVWDYGDLPASYETTGYSAARHLTSSEPTLYLGEIAPDDEFDGHPTLSADGDNASGVDEEAFSQFPTLSASLIEYVLNVPLVNNSGTDASLFGWIDFNDDGQFSVDEQASALVADSETTAVLTWNDFTLVAPDTTYLRLRLTSDTGNINPENSSGSAPDGEVEDYAINVGSATAVTLASFDAQPGKQMQAGFSLVFIILILAGAIIMLPVEQLVPYLKKLTR